MIKKKIIITVLAAVLLFAAVGTTLAILSDISGPVENTFTVGDINITLDESTGTEYQLIPGKAISKDPKVTVAANSEASWLFIEVTETENLDEYLTYEIEDGWTVLGGHDGVYYRNVIKSTISSVFPIIKENKVTVREDLTEEKIDAITAIPKISFKAYAVQEHTVENALDAWNLIKEENNG